MEPVIVVDDDGRDDDEDEEDYTIIIKVKGSLYTVLLVYCDLHIRTYSRILLFHFLYLPEKYDILYLTY